MPIQTSYERVICDELDGLMARSRRIQQMLILLGSVQSGIMLDFQTAVDDIRECSCQIKLWLTAEPKDRDGIITRAVEFRANTAERSVRGLLADLAYVPLTQDHATPFLQLARRLSSGDSPVGVK